MTVTGPRGSLKRDFRHMGVDLVRVGKRRLRVDLWFGNRKQIAAVRTISTHIKNMVTGVRKVGYPKWK